MNALYRIQKKAAAFNFITKYSDWFSVAQVRTLAQLCAHFKAYSAERAWKTIRYRLSWPHYLNGVVHCLKLRDS